MKNISTSLLVLTSIFALALTRGFGGPHPVHGGMMAGGFSDHSINELTKKIALNLLQKINEAKNGELEGFLKSEKQLVKYSTQVVAGINYGLVYSIQSGDNAGKHHCFKIYKAPDGMVQMSHQGVEDTIEDA